MCDQQGAAARQLQYEPLVPGAVIVVGDQARDVTTVLYPVAVVSLAVTAIYAALTRL